MKIDLEYILTRNKSSLKNFIEHYKINSYEQLLVICEEKKFIPVSREKFESHFKVQPDEKNEQSDKKQTKAKPTRKTQTKTGRASSAPRKRRARSSSKNVEDTQ